MSSWKSSRPTKKVMHYSLLHQVAKPDREIGYVKTYIISPSTIYGISKGKLVDAGINNPHSQQVPGLIKIGLARGQGGMVGQGKNLWPNVEIHEREHIFRQLYQGSIACSPLISRAALLHSVRCRSHQTRYGPWPRRHLLRSQRGA